MAGVKLQKLQSQLSQEVSLIIAREVDNANIKFVTITKSELTSDLSFLTLHINVIGNRDKTIDALRRTSGFIRSSLSKKLNLRKTPKLIFKFDTSMEKLNNVEKILKGIKEN